MNRTVFIPSNEIAQGLRVCSELTAVKASRQIQLAARKEATIRMLDVHESWDRPQSCLAGRACVPARAGGE